MNKKILILASTFPTNNQDKIPSFVKYQIEAFKENYQDIEFIVLAPSFQGIAPLNSKDFVHLRYRYFFKKYEVLTKHGILPTIKENFIYIFLIPFFIFFQIIYALKVVKLYNPDHLYAHWVTPQAITALIINKLKNIPYSFSSHAHDAEILSKLPILGKLILNYIVKNSYSFTFDTENTKQKLKKYIFTKNWDESKCLVLAMGVNTKLLEIQKKKFKNDVLNGKTVQISYVGRFAEKKGVELLIDSFSNLLTKNYDLNLTLCGVGPLLEKYEDSIRKLKIQSKVKIIQSFNDPKMLNAVYSFSDIIVIPSVLTKGGDVEGLPVVALEALYLGKVVVCSSYTNLSEIIEDKISGFIYNGGNSIELTQILEDILNKKYNLENIRSNAKKIGAEYSLNKISKNYFEHLFPLNFQNS